MRKIFFIRCISYLFFVLLGVSLAFFLVGAFDQAPVFFLTHHHWATFISLFVICLFLLEFYLAKLENLAQKNVELEVVQKQEESAVSASDLRNDLEQFKKEVIHVCRQMLHSYILYKKESVEKNYPQQEAQKEAFRELKKEFVNVRWMLEIIDDVKKLVKEEKQSCRKEEQDKKK